MGVTHYPALGSSDFPHADRVAPPDARPSGRLADCSILPDASLHSTAVNGSPASERTDERKLVTILFADLVGSTELGERLDPERLQALLRAYFGAMAGVIERWGGTVEKYIGDAIMAVFGVPMAHEDDPRRAVGAALEMVSTLEGLNLGFRDRFGVTLQARIGVNTGNVMAPVGGPEGEMIVLGDAVNVAARLEQAAEAAAILVGDRTHAAVSDLFGFGDARTLELRGKSQPVMAWPVLGPRLEPEATQGRLQSPIVGRERERRVLADALDDGIETGSLRLVVVFGPAGIGKSRLVREFTDDATKARADLHVVRGRCLSAGDGITYWALGEIVRREFGIALDDPIELAGQRLERGVRDVLAKAGAADAEIMATIHALGISAGIRLPENPLVGLRPTAVAIELALAWPRFVSALAKVPLVILIEDLHWADSQLLAILDSIRTRSTGPVLVLATARPEFADDPPECGVARDGSMSITLRPLLAGEAAGVLQNLVGAGALPETVRAEVLDRADGNPFFIEQLVGGLVDAGALASAGEGWRFHGGVAPEGLPDTVQAVLAARLDRLAPEHKLVLQEAAVVGRAFWPSAVALSIDQPTVDDALLSLESKGFVVARPTSSVGGQVEFAFKHALILDVAYQGVPLARRARSHARAAAWLQDLAGPDDEALIELVAHHYRSALLADGADLAWADEPEAHAATRGRAFETIVAAGAVARRRNAIDRAVELHAAALAIAISDAERASVLEELGDDHGWGMHGDPSTEAWGHALELFRVAGDDDAIARISVKAGRLSAMFYGGFTSRPSAEVVDGYVDEGLKHAREPVTRAWLLALRGRAAETWAAERRPDPLGAGARIAAAEEAVAIAESVGDRDLRIVALRVLDGLRVLAGDDARALEIARELVASLDQVAALRDRLITGHQTGALVMDIAGEFEGALEVYRGTRPLAMELSVHEQMHQTYFTMAALYRLARWDEMLPLAREHLETYDRETVDMSCPYTRSGSVVASIVFEQLGRLDEMAEAERRIAPNDARPGLVEAWLAERALRRGDAAEARDIALRMGGVDRPTSFDEGPYEQPVLVEALARLREWDALAAIVPGLRGRSTRLAWLGPAIDRAEAAQRAAAGHEDDARQLLRSALDGYQRLQMPVEAAETRAQLAEAGG
jgi:class 3 adenylate cyclase